MNELQKARKEIDQVDKQMTDLFIKRFEAVKKVLEYKLDNHLPIKDEGREAEIMARNLARISDEDLQPYFQDYFAYLMDVSKRYQKDLLNSK